MGTKYDASKDELVAVASLDVTDGDGSVAYTLEICAARYNGGPIKYYLAKCGRNGAWMRLTIGRQLPHIMTAFFRQIDNLNAYLEKYAP